MASALDVCSRLRSSVADRKSGRPVFKARFISILDAASGRFVEANVKNTICLMANIKTRERKKVTRLQLDGSS